MRWVAYLFGSGLVFFIGAVCVLIAVVLFAIRRRRWQLQVGNAACLLGSVLIALSAVPFDYWFYGVVGLVTLVMLIAEQFSQTEFGHRRTTLRAVTAVCLLAGIVLELCHQFSPTVAARGSPDLYVIADSVTAGVDDPRIVTWPKLLAKSHARVTVHDFSRVGATVSSAYAQAERLPPTGDLVLLEIGGNDLLGSTTVADYERHLERLLTRVSAANRAVVMFELPLPPLCNEYGRIQRRLAARHGVSLIPRRVLIGVLTGDQATTDSIHLAQAGHDHMAAVVWNVIQPAYGAVN